MPWEHKYVPTTLETAKPEDIKDAIHLKSANCWCALSIANALGGTPSPGWDLAHAIPLKRLIEVAKERNIDLAGLKSAVDGIPVEESLYFRRAAGTMTEEEFRKAFRAWQNGK